MQEDGEGWGGGGFPKRKPGYFYQKTGDFILARQKQQCPPPNLRDVLILHFFHLMCV